MTDVYYWIRDSTKPIVINQGGTSCFAPDTKVVTYSGLKNISEIKVGDLVKTKESQFKRVLNTFEYKNTKQTVEVTMKDGSTFKCTEDHEFFYKGKWTPIIDILYEKDNTRV